MCKIKIATDSTADIPKSFCEELDISVLPLTILAGDNEYRDGVDITPAEFYKIIDASKQLPVSSQVASVLYSELFEETWKAGYADDRLTEFHIMYHKPVLEDSVVKAQYHTDGLSHLVTIYADNARCALVKLK